MGISRRNIILLHSLFIFLSLILHCRAAEKLITTTQYITDPQSVVSSAETFRLGFFSPGNLTNRYVGIWFNDIPGPTTVVWVANRDNPLKDSSGVLKISDDGNLEVLDGRKNVLWNSNASNTPVNSVAELLDSGNLILREITNTSISSNSNSGRILWQSFDHPSDTLLPGMKFGVNLKTGEELVLTSWEETDSDPSTGNFSLGIDPINIPQIIITYGSNKERHWRSGPWNRRNFIGIPTVLNVYLNGFNLDDDKQDGTAYLTLDSVNKSILSISVISSDGKLVQKVRNGEKKEWFDYWYSGSTECDIYGKCGSFGVCDASSSPICSCLRGFKPKFEDEWSKWNWSGGCVRKTELQCQRMNRTSERNNITSTDAIGKEADRFLKLTKMKVPDYANSLPAQVEIECEQKCLNNCSCVAYSYDHNVVGR